MLNRRAVSVTLAGVIIAVVVVAAVGSYVVLVSQTSNSSPSELFSLATSSSPEALACSNVAPYDETIPPTYESIYTTLNQILDNFNQTLSSMTPAANHQVVYATELLPADSNIGDRLLAPQAMQGVVNFLNAIQKLGIDGVTIDISYPILTPNYPNYEQYLSFYESVFQQVRARGMKTDVETETPLLVGYPGLSLGTVNYVNLTYSTYLPQDRAMIQTIIDDLHPDYLNIGTETDTLQSLLPFPEISTPQGWGTYIHSLLTGLNKGTTKINVGIGTWDSISYLYATLNESAVNAIDIHIYPIYGNYLTILTQIGQLSQQYGKPIVIDEMWLHKSVMNEGHNFATDAQISSRNLYAFWIPLDEKFLQVMAKYSEVYNVAFMSPFEATYLFAYLNYTTNSADVPYSDARAVAARSASYNIANGFITPLGCYYQTLIDGQAQLVIVPLIVATQPSTKPRTSFLPYECAITRMH